jgi:hypothetical protein
LIVVQIALICLYQRFTLKLTPGQLPLAVHTNLTMAPTHGVKVLVQRRPQQHHASCATEAMYGPNDL